MIDPTKVCAMEQRSFDAVVRADPSYVRTYRSTTPAPMVGTSMMLTKRCSECESPMGLYDPHNECELCAEWRDHGGG